MTGVHTRLMLTLNGGQKAHKSSMGDIAAHALDASLHQAVFAHWSIKTFQNSTAHRQTIGFQPKQVPNPAKRFVPVCICTWTGTWHR